MFDLILTDSCDVQSSTTYSMFFSFVDLPDQPLISICQKCGPNIDTGTNLKHPIRTKMNNTIVNNLSRGNKEKKRAETISSYQNHYSSTLKVFYF